MTDDQLTSFLYILMRDHLPSGVVEDIMAKHVENIGNDEVRFSNPHLEAHARELASRLVGPCKAEPPAAGLAWALHRWLEDWTPRWWDYGVNALAGWLTPEGRAEAARRRADLAANRHGAERQVE